MTKKQLNADFEEYFALEAQIKELEKKQDEIKKRLKEAANKTEEKMLVDGDYKVQLINCNRSGFDLKAFSETHPRLAQKFATSTPYVQTKIMKLNNKTK